MSTVLAIMLAQQPAWGETETYVERSARLEVIAAAASIESAFHPEGWRWSALTMTATLGTDLDATQLCMRGAARILSYYAATCVSEWRATNDLEGSLARVIAGYGTGHTCSTDGRPWATKRARRAVKWLRELEAA